MLKILADKTLPLLNLFHPTFTVTFYDDLKTLKSHLPSHDILLCRSTLKVNEALLKKTNISCVATASSGTDHIDKTYLDKNHITLLDAKGCNAHAVADYVSSSLSWILKHRGLLNTAAGVIGLGHVGRKVAQRLRVFGLTVHEYDPPRAEVDPSFQTITLEAIQNCGLLCLHPDLHRMQPHATYHLINAHFLEKLAPKTVIINASRGNIVDETALLSSSIVYCTDVYNNEPEIQSNIVDYATLCTPHIAGHSIEAKKNAIIYLVAQLHAHFQQPLAQDISACSPIKRHKQIGLVDDWLEHYDPSQETLALKYASDKTKAFIELRKAHQFRHDVDWE